MESNNEKPIIFAVITLFLTFTLVYLAFFRNQSSSILPSDKTLSNLTGDESFIVDTWSRLNDVDAILDDNGRVDLTKPQTTGSFLSGSNITPLSSWTQKTTLPSVSIPVNNSFSSLKKKVENVSGLSPWYNSIKIAETLALDIKFAFSDTWSIQYGYLGTGSIDTINQIIKRLWWNVVAIETENDISTNSLRWDRILFINIPQVTLIRTNGTEKRLLVAFVVEIGSDKWLIQAPAERYYTSKQRMKLLFENIYGKFL